MCVCLCTCVDTYRSTRHTSNSSIWKFEKLRQGDEKFEASEILSPKSSDKTPQIRK